MIYFPNRASCVYIQHEFTNTFNKKATTHQQIHFSFSLRRSIINVITVFNRIELNNHDIKGIYHTNCMLLTFNLRNMNEIYSTCILSFNKIKLKRRRKINRLDSGIKIKETKRGKRLFRNIKILGTSRRSIMCV